MITCEICNDKKYLIHARLHHESGKSSLVVERCDECSADTLSDEDAAKLAIADGWNCETEYPCYVKDDPSEIETD